MDRCCSQKLTKEMADGRDFKLRIAVDKCVRAFAWRCSIVCRHGLRSLRTAWFAIVTHMCLYSGGCSGYKYTLSMDETPVDPVADKCAWLRGVARGTWD